MAEQHDLLKARRESAALLGLGDVERLSPADTLRCDLISTLRLAIDGERATVLDGGSADLAKLITATENLIRLLPGKALPEPDGGPNDPRQIMFETYMGMRKRGELFDPCSTYEGMKAEVERLKAKVAELETGAPDGSTATPPAPAVSGGNVVKLHDNPGRGHAAPAAPPKPAPPAAASAPRTVDVNALPPAEPEPWRAFVNGDGSIRSQPRGRWDV
jgi:hypothetical protein